MKDNSIQHKTSKYIINGKFLSQNITGVQRYAREIINELDKIVDKGIITLAYPKNATNLPLLNNIDLIQIGPFTGNLWEQVSLPLYAKRKKCTVVNLCGPSPILFPGIVVLHDVTYKAFPETFTKTFRVWYDIMNRNAIKHSKQIITISRFSESEIKRYYPTKKTFTIIPNAWQHIQNIVIDESIFDRLDIKKNDYYFALGSLKPNKNLRWIIEIANRNKDDLFIVAGAINSKVFSDGLNFEKPNNVRFVGYVSDEEAKALMKYSIAFLFPSTYEGFGIPPLEAIAAGCNSVIVNDIPVMHEIFDESVTYISGYDLTVIPCNPKVLDKFSWHKSATLLLDVLL